MKLFDYSNVLHIYVIVIDQRMSENRTTLLCLEYKCTMPISSPIKNGISDIDTDIRSRSGNFFKWDGHATWPLYPVTVIGHCEIKK